MSGSLRIVPPSRRNVQISGIKMGNLAGPRTVLYFPHGEVVFMNLEYELMNQNERYGTVR